MIFTGLNGYFILDFGLLFTISCVRVLQVVPAWLNCLPIKGDLVEAKIVHDQLCSLVERQVYSLISSPPAPG